MNLLLVTAVLALGGGEGQAGKGGGGASLDGKWQIVYAEEGGRRNNSWEQRMATVKGGTLSYEGEGGKKRSLKLKAGKGQTVEATSDEKGETWKGVYILGQDYLCLSFSKGGAMKGRGGAGGPASGPVAAPVAGGAPAVGGAPAAGGGQAGHGSSGDFILIMRRVRGGAAISPKADTAK
jgi:hypothetical protein